MDICREVFGLWEVCCKIIAVSCYHWYELEAALCVPLANDRLLVTVHSSSSHQGS